MQVKEVGGGRWFLVLERGEEVVGTVSRFLEEREIRAGFVTGVGALRNHTLGYYDLEAKEYLKRTFEEVMELGNLTASIGSVEGKPFLHAHATVSGPELIAFTGHLFEGEVAVTAELLVWSLPGFDFPRVRDEEIGLNLFEIEPRPAEEDAGGDSPDGAEEGGGEAR